mmetsp:Transcript_70877/g.140492  ORF Transcript_70877/g.140492 Transcript_70877/m.140492 type:complete len:304 (-) Transcript_70877:165-1076(-)
MPGSTPPPLHASALRIHRCTLNASLHSVCIESHPGPTLAAQSSLGLSEVRTPRRPSRREINESINRIQSREADDAWRVGVEVEVDLVVGRLDGQARDERDGTEGDDKEAGSRRNVDVLYVHLKATGCTQLGGVVAQAVLRLAHAHRQHADRRIHLVLADSAFGCLRVGCSRSTVHTTHYLLDLGLDVVRLSIIHELKVVDVGLGARLHHCFPELDGPSAALCVMLRLHRVEGPMLYRHLANESDLRVGVGGEAIDRHDGHHAVSAHIGNVLLQVGHTCRNELQVLLLVLFCECRPGDDFWRLA